MMVSSHIQGLMGMVVLCFEKFSTVNVPPKFNEDRVSNPKTQGGNDGGSS